MIFIFFKELVIPYKNRINNNNNFSLTIEHRIIHLSVYYLENIN